MKLFYELKGHSFGENRSSNRKNKGMESSALVPHKLHAKVH